MSYEEFKVTSELSPYDIKPIYPAATRIGTKVFIIQAAKVYRVMRDRFSDSKFIALAEKLKPSEEMLERFPFLLGGYTIYSDIDGRLFASPISIIYLWRRTFTGCMRLSNDNQLASCLMALASVGLSLWPGYEHRNAIFPIAQVFIRLAYSSVVKDLDDLEDIFVDNFGPNGGVYGQI